MRTTRTILALLAATLIACGGDSGTPTHTLKVEKWPPSGDNQTDTVGQTLTKPIRVKVTFDGATVAGYMVHFAGGVLGTDSILTGADGIATSTWTLTGHTGLQFVTASVDSATGSPLTFKATGVTGAAFALVKVSGDSQSTGTNQFSLPAPLVMKVVDQFDNGVEGRWVYFTTADSNTISLGADSIITSSLGLISLNVHTGATPGQATITATAKDSISGSPLTYHVTVTP